MSETLLAELGFDAEFCRKIGAYARILDSKEKLESAPIEVKIVSTADGCSHLVGPFLSIWWRENDDAPIEELMAENRRKIRVAWDVKIVLQEARLAFRQRFAQALEQIRCLSGVFLDFQWKCASE